MKNLRDICNWFNRWSFIELRDQFFWFFSPRPNDLNLMWDYWDAAYLNPPPQGCGGGDNCCVIEGTFVLLADGTNKPIEAITAGDQLADGFGGVATAVGIVEMPLGARTAAVVNGVTMTKGHPIRTPTGWAVRDETELRNDPMTNLIVGGDRVFAAYDALGAETESLETGDLIVATSGPITANVTEVSFPATTRFFTPLAEGSTFVAGNLVLGALRVVHRVTA